MALRLLTIMPEDAADTIPEYDATKIEIETKKQEDAGRDVGEVELEKEQIKSAFITDTPDEELQKIIGPSKDKADLEADDRVTYHTAEFDKMAVRVMRITDPDEGRYADYLYVDE